MVNVSAQQLLDLSRENRDLKAQLVAWQETARLEQSRVEKMRRFIEKVDPDTYWDPDLCIERGELLK